MASSSKTTKDHDEIRNWAEERGGKPAHVSSTGSKDDIGILRIEFPSAPGSNDSNLEELSWEQFFEKFDERGLALLYQEETASGERSNFNKLVSSETAEETDARPSSHSSNGHRPRKSSPKKTAAKKAQAGRSAALVKKAAVAKKTAAPKKAAPTKKAAAKKSAPAKKGAPAKKSAPAKKGAPAKKSTAASRLVKKTTTKKSAPKVARKKVAAPAKKASKGAAAKRTGAKKSTSRGRR